MTPEDYESYARAYDSAEKREKERAVAASSKPLGPDEAFAVWKALPRNASLTRDEEVRIAYKAGWLQAKLQSP